MLLLLAILGIGLLLGWGFGGGLRNLAFVRIGLWWLAPFALALQVAPIPRIEGAFGQFLPSWSLAFSLLVLVVVALVNWRLWGFPLVLLGLSLNLVVIAVNEGMPVSPAALEEVGRGKDIEELATAERGAKNHLETEEDLIRPLGDVIPIRAPFKVVVSAGDLLAYTGVAVFVGMAMLRRPTVGREPPPRQARRAAT